MSDGLFYAPHVRCEYCGSIWSPEWAQPLLMQVWPCTGCCKRMIDTIDRLRAQNHASASEHERRTAKLQARCDEYHHLFNTYRSFYKHSKKDDTYDAYWVGDVWKNGEVYWHIPSAADRAGIGALVNENALLRQYIEKLLNHHERNTDHLCDWRVDYEMIDPSIPKGTEDTWEDS